MCVCVCVCVCMRARASEVGGGGRERQAVRQIETVTLALIIDLYYFFPLFSVRNKLCRVLNDKRSTNHTFHFRLAAGRVVTTGVDSMGVCEVTR